MDSIVKSAKAGKQFEILFASESIRLDWVFL